MPVPPGLSTASLMQVFFLHGFASSAKSTKAAYFWRAPAVARHPVSLSGFQRA